MDTERSQSEPETIEYKNTDTKSRIYPNNAWPVVLIIIGLYFLLRNYNIISDRILEAVVDAWPLILVWLGVQMGTKNNPRLRFLGLIVVVSLFVFIVLQNAGVNLPTLR
jgi:hypothetical protein